MAFTSFSTLVFISFLLKYKNQLRDIFVYPVICIEKHFYVCGWFFFFFTLAYCDFTIDTHIFFNFGITRFCFRILFRNGLRKEVLDLNQRKNRYIMSQIQIQNCKLLILPKIKYSFISIPIKTQHSFIVELD